MKSIQFHNYKVILQSLLKELLLELSMMPKNRANKQYRKEVPRTINGVTSNLPIMRCAYIALIVLATVFSMAWNKTYHHGISQLPLVFSWYTHLSKGSCVINIYHKNTSDTWDINSMVYHCLEIVA